MKNKWILWTLLICLSSCKIFYKQYKSSCDCHYKSEMLSGIYEESYLKPKGEHRIWLEKAVLVSNGNIYGLGSISSTEMIDCPNLEKVLRKDTVKMFYGESFYPKDEVATVSKTTNLFYNADSSRMIIAFNVTAKVLKLNEKPKYHTGCVKMLQRGYYGYAYNMNGIVKEEPLGFVNAVFTGVLSEDYMRQKGYTFATDVKPFSYWTGD